MDGRSGRRRHRGCGRRGGAAGRRRSRPPEDPRQAFATLLGLDAALAHANPLSGVAAPPALTEYALRYAEAGRFDSGALPGALLPRFARPGRRGQLPDDLADAFGSVVRVDATRWEACDHVALPARSRLTRPEREAGLRVATAPMIREPDELSGRSRSAPACASTGSTPPTASPRARGSSG